MPSNIIQPRFMGTVLATGIPKEKLLPIFSNSSVKPIVRNRLKVLEKVNLNSFTDVNKSVASLKLKSSEVHSALRTFTKKNNSQKSINFTRAMITNWKTKEDALSHSREMLNWARVGKKADRTIVCKAFIASKQTDLLVHNIGGMERADARKFMKDFFASGGTSKDAYEWLSGAGRFLRKNNITESNKDGFFDWVGDLVSDAVDWVWGAITTVSDAVEAALDDFSRAIGEIVSWTVDKISDVVRSLIAAGKSVATILNAAFDKGISAMKKFVQAIIKAGRSTLSVLEWAVGEVSSAIRGVVRALISAGKSVIRIVKSAIRGARSLVRKIVQALIDIGHDVEDMIHAVINATTTQVKNLVDAFLRAGQGILEILRETLSEAAAAIKNVVRALFDLGKSLGELILTSLQQLGSSFLRRVLKAMLSLGKTLSSIMNRAIQVASGLLRRLARALARIGQSVQNIIRTVRSATSIIIKRVITGLRDAARRVSEVLSAVASYIGSRLRKMITAIYQVFRNARKIVIAFMRKTTSVIRTVLEGLFAAGLNFAKALKTILENVVSEFQKGFIAGLVALGHSVVDIMGEALKLTGALTALAFTAILELFGGHRSLTSEEKKAARAIFGWSIDLDKIKIANASLPADLILKVNGGRPFTTMHIINFSSKTKVSIRTLIHELTHTWQGVEVGPVYMVEALHDQFALGSRDAYEVTPQMLEENNGNFSKFGREQQATLVDTYYAYKLGKRKDDSDADERLAALAPYALQVYRRKDGLISFDPRVISDFTMRDLRLSRFVFNP